MIYARGPDSNKLADYASRHGWDDVRATGDFQEVIRAVRAGRVDAVLCAGLRGLGKSLPELASMIRELAECRVSLVIPSLGIVDGGSRTVLLRLLDALEESANVMVKESTKRGLARARRRGVRLGRPATLDAHRDDVNRLRAQGRTGRAIAQELGLPNGSVFQLMKGGQSL